MNSVEATRLALVDHDLAGNSMTSAEQAELKVRRVRTPAGARRYGQPIGSIITRDSIRRAKQRLSGRRRGRGGRNRNGRGGGGVPNGIGAPSLLGQLFSGNKPKKPRKGPKGRKPRKRAGGSGGSGSPGSGGSGGRGGRGSNRSGGGTGGASNGQYGNRVGGGGGVLGDNIDRGRRDTVGRKSLPSVEATRERFWGAVEKGLDLGLEEKVGSKTRLYFFGGPGGDRNTGIAATSAADARKRKRRGGDRVVATHKPNAQERAAMDRGEWVRTRRDGKSPARSRYGKGRGQGPPRSSN